MPEPTASQVSLLLTANNLPDGDSLIFDGSIWADHKICGTGMSIAATGGVNNSGAIKASIASPVPPTWTAARFARPAGQAITIQGRVFPRTRANQTAAPGIIRLRDPVASQVLFQADVYGLGNQLSYSFNLGDGAQVHTYTPLGDGSFHFALCCGADNLGRFYVNEVLVASYAGMGNTLGSNPGEFKLGNSQAGGSGSAIDCRFDEIRFSRIDEYPDGVTIPAPFDTSSTKSCIVWPAGTPQ